MLRQRPDADVDTLQELAHRAEAARYARPSTDAGDAAAADTLRKQLLTWLDHDESAVDRTRRRLFPASATR